MMTEIRLITQLLTLMDSGIHYFYFLKSVLYLLQDVRKTGFQTHCTIRDIHA